MKYNPIWYERYRPKTLGECILPSSILNQFKGFVTKNEIPNLILSGGPGRGKTTSAMALCNDLNYDVLFVNGSLQGRRMDVLREDIEQHASTVSFTGNRKMVIVDEADGMTADVQKGLRAFIEQYSDNCGFILTCNYKGGIIPALSESRFTEIDYNFPAEEKQAMCVKMYRMVQKILIQNNVPFDKEVLVDFVIDRFPDFRRTINDLQNYSARGQIDKGILTTVDDEMIKTVLTMLKSKDFKGMREWVAKNTVDVQGMMSKLYRTAANDKMVVESDIPAMIMLLNRFQIDQHQAIDKEVFLAACLTELMYNVQWR